MRCVRLSTFFVLTIVLVAPTVLSAKAIKGGREYIKAKKQLVRDKRDVRDFATLLAEMDDLRIPRQMRDFWDVNANLRKAMKREYEAVTKKLKNEGVSMNDSGELPQSAGAGVSPRNYLDAAGDWTATPGQDSERLPTPQLATRMKAIITESHGLQRIMAAGELDAMSRYRHLLGEFLQLMRDKVAAAEEELESGSAQ